MIVHGSATRNRRICSTIHRNVNGKAIKMESRARLKTAAQGHAYLRVELGRRVANLEV